MSRYLWGIKWWNAENYIYMYMHMFIYICVWFCENREKYGDMTSKCLTSVVWVLEGRGIREKKEKEKETGWKKHVSWLDHINTFV